MLSKSRIRFANSEWMRMQGMCSWLRVLQSPFLKRLLTEDLCLRESRGRLMQDCTKRLQKYNIYLWSGGRGGNLGVDYLFQVSDEWWCEPGHGDWCTCLEKYTLCRDGIYHKV